MLDNPLSQIERTKDAYAGNMQGLQKRANMTKELVDLLAMQQLKKDLDAAKRNQAMQAQGNPATIKDQMQQGLMSEYRQKAAKEMGVGPSEADTVARAQQGGPRMPQGAPQQQMPQGAPQQQMPQQQMAQGMMSQARPVQLAGGGIVAFNEGGPTEDELAEFLKAAAEKRRASEPSPSSIMQTDRQREMQELIARLAERRKEPTIDLSGTKSEIQERRRKQALESQMEEMFTPETGGIQVGQMPRPEPIVDEDAQYAEEQRLMGEMSQKEVDAEIEERAGLAAVAQTPAPEQTEQTEQTEIQNLLMQKLRADIGRDPEAAGARRAAMIRRELGLDEGIATLADRKARREQAFRDTQPSKMDNLIDLLAAGGKGGLASIGARGGERRKEARDRRMAYENKLDEIENTSMELRRSIGTTAANEYSKAATRDLQTINNAATVLQRMDVEDRQRFESELNRKRQDAKLEIDRTNALGKLLGSTKTFAEAAEKLTEGISSISERIRDPYETRRALLEQRALSGDEQAKKDLESLEDTISLQIINDPEYLRLQAMLTGLDAERKASEAQRAGLAAGLANMQGANISSAGESALAAVEGR